MQGFILSLFVLGNRKLPASLQTASASARMLQGETTGKHVRIGRNAKNRRCFSLLLTSSGQAESQRGGIRTDACYIGRSDKGSERDTVAHL